MDNNLFFFSLLILLLSCASCGGKETLFREDQNTPNGWRLDQPAVFTIQENLSSPVDLYIHLRNDQAYPFSNIFLIATVKSKDSLIESDTLEYAMAKYNGEWLGTGFSSVKESKLWWKENWQTQEAFPLTIEIAQANRVSGREKAAAQLAGIVSIGLSINARE
jgi:gliding motility-associated lipoprotein GldH